MTAATANVILNGRFRGLLRRTCPVGMSHLEGNVAELGKQRHDRRISNLNEAYWELSARLRPLEILTNTAPSALKLGLISLTQGS